MYIFVTLAANDGLFWPKFNFNLNAKIATFTSRNFLPVHKTSSYQNKPNSCIQLQDKPVRLH